MKYKFIKWNVTNYKKKTQNNKTTSRSICGIFVKIVTDIIMGKKNSGFP